MCGSRDTGAGELRMLGKDNKLEVDAEETSRLPLMKRDMMMIKMN